MMKKKLFIVLMLTMAFVANAMAQQSEPAKKRVKVACVGNSITEGVGSGNADLYSYPAQLQQLMGMDYRVRNFGKSGHTLMTSGDRPWIKTEKWRDCKKWKPAIVIIKLGTNDSKPINAGRIKSDFQRDLLALIDSFQALPSVKQIYLCTPVPCVSENRYNIDGKVIEQQIVPIISKVVKKRKLRLIDLHQTLSGHAELFPDKVHPNREGAALIAQAVAAAMGITPQQPAANSQLDIYLCIGQSNMAGRAQVTGATALQPIEGVWLLNDKDEFEVAQNPLNRYSTIRKDLSMQRLSIAYMFSKKMHELTGQKVGLVCNARGETSIKQWQKGHERGYYEEAVRRTKAAMKYGTLRGIIWHQGEWDCTHDLQEYQQLLRQFISDLRHDLGCPNLPVVYGQISQWNWTKTEAGTKPFNDMIVTMPQQIPNTACATSEDLTPAIGEHDPHFSSKSQKTYGQRFAEKMIGLQKQ